MQRSQRLVGQTGIHIATESFGDRNNTPILLIMGATASMLGWPNSLCEVLASAGRFVIRYDHRDTGQSTSVPPGEAHYSVEDLAQDAAALLDAYGLAKAHIVGMSLGGLIAQIIAVSQPQRVGSLTLIAAEPLGWDGPPMPEISPELIEHFGKLATLDWSDRDAVIDFLATIDVLSANDIGADDEAVSRARAAAVVDHAANIQSMFNHASIDTNQDWSGAFRTISCPVLVVYGSADSIVAPANGRAIAAALPDAECLVLEGVGHELPSREIERIGGAIIRLTGEAPLE